jgi:hypothetical protein
MTNLEKSIFPRPSILGIMTRYRDTPGLNMGITMRKYSLLLAVMLAASFSTVADAAKKKAAAPAPKDAVYEWNIKNMPPMAQPGSTAAAPAKAAKKVKKAKKSSKKAKKA